MKNVKTFEDFRSNRIEEALDQKEVLNILDAAAMFADDAEVAANQTWKDRDDLIKYLMSDHIAKKDHKKFLKYVGESEEEAIEESYEDLISKLGLNEENFYDRPEVKKINAAIAKLKEAQSKLEDELDKLDDQKRAIYNDEGPSAKYEALKKKMDAGNAKFDKIDGKIQELRDKLDSLRENNSVDAKEESICEATVEMDAMNPDDKDFLKFLKKNRVKIIRKEKGGPGGNYPIITMQGKRKDLEKVLADDELGFGDPDLGEYIEESIVNEAKLNKGDTAVIAQKVADIFTQESADEKEFLKYVVSKGVSPMSFDLDVEATKKTPKKILDEPNYFGEYAGGSFVIKR